MSSSSDDSETTEWEREQMLRGTQSRARHHNTSQQSKYRTDRSSNVIDATTAKLHIDKDIEKAESALESAKRNIGSIKLDLARSEKREEALRKEIEQLESHISAFEELATLKDPSEISDWLEKNKSLISKLPHDQREMIESLEKPERVEID